MHLLPVSINRHPLFVLLIASHGNSPCGQRNLIPKPRSRYATALRAGSWLRNLGAFEARLSRIPRSSMWQRLAPLRLACPSKLRLVGGRKRTASGYFGGLAGTHSGICCFRICFFGRDIAPCRSRNGQPGSQTRRYYYGWQRTMGSTTRLATQSWAP